MKLFDNQENSLLALLDNYGKLKQENEQIKLDLAIGKKINEDNLQKFDEYLKKLKQELSKRDKALELAREALKSIKNIGGGEPYSSNRAEVALTAINEALGGRE